MVGHWTALRETGRKEKERKRGEVYEGWGGGGRERESEDGERLRQGQREGRDRVQRLYFPLRLNI